MTKKDLSRFSTCFPRFLTNVFMPVCNFEAICKNLYVISVKRLACSAVEEDISAFVNSRAGGVSQERLHNIPLQQIVPYYSMHSEVVVGCRESLFGPTTTDNLSLVMDCLGATMEYVPLESVGSLGCWPQRFALLLLCGGHQSACPQTMVPGHSPGWPSLSNPFSLRGALAWEAAMPLPPHLPIGAGGAGAHSQPISGPPPVVPKRCQHSVEGDNDFFRHTCTC